MSSFRNPLSRLVFPVFLVTALATGQAGLALERVQFSVAGQDEGLDGLVRGASGLLSLEEERNTPEDILAAARAEYGRLIGALYAAGHYAPVISVRLDGREAAGIAPLDRPAQIGRIEVQVDPGPQFKFGRTQIEPVAYGTEFPEGFRTGEAAEAGVVRQAVQAGVDGWRNEGHAKAKVTSQDVVADHPNRRLDAAVRLTPGPKLRFGAVSVKGHERMRENRVRKIAGIPEGETYSPAEVDRAVNRLRRTGTFSSVSITENEQITRPDLLRMNIAVVEEKPRHLSFGAEVSSLEGATLSAAWTHRNLLGGAERLKVFGEISNLGAADSGVDYLLGLTLERPATFTPDTTLRFATEISHVDEVDFRADGLDLGFGLTHIFSDNLTARVDLAYEYINGTAYSADRLRSTDFIYRSLSAPIGVTWDRRNNKTDATDGFYIEAEAKPFLGFGTTGSGLRLSADLRGYQDFGKESRFVAAARLQFGMVTGADLLDTPRDELFYSGGGGTVRGQPYQSLGVTINDGGADYKIGGNHFMSASVELRAKVTQSIGLVGFVDAGRVDTGSFFDGAGDWHAGAGLGVRYATGVGPIRLDIAGPVGGKTGDGVQIYVGLGQAF